MNANEFMKERGLTNEDLDRMAAPYEEGTFELEPNGEVFSDSHLDAVEKRCITEKIDCTCPARNKMYCPECGSPNVNVQVVQVTQVVPKHHSIIWWICIGWWWIPFKWLYLTIPALIVKLFAPKRQMLVQTTHSVCVCQECGHHWDV